MVCIFCIPRKTSRISSKHFPQIHIVQSKFLLNSQAVRRKRTYICSLCSVNRYLVLQERFSSSLAGNTQFVCEKFLEKHVFFYPSTMGLGILEQDEKKTHFKENVQTTEKKIGKEVEWQEKE